MAAGSVSAHRGDGVGVGRSTFAQTVVQHADGHPVPHQQPPARDGVDGRGELEHDRKVVGGLVDGWLHARVAVGLGEGMHLPAAVAGVAAGPVRQVHRAAASQVEGFDVVDCGLHRIGRGQRSDRAGQQLRRRSGGAGAEVFDGSQALGEILVGIGQQQ